MAPRIKPQGSITMQNEGQHGRWSPLPSHARLSFGVMACLSPKLCVMPMGFTLGIY